MDLREEARRAAAEKEHPPHVMDAGGPDRYAAGQAQALGLAINEADWDAVRRIAEDPYTAGEDVDLAKGALAGAMQSPAPSANGNGRHGVPDTHVYDPDKGGYLAPGAPLAELERLRGSIERAQAAEVSRTPVVTQGTPLHLTPFQHEALLKPLAPSRVKDLKGQSYLEAWDIRRHLTRFFGFGGWDLITRELALVREITNPPGTVKQTKWVSGTKKEVMNDREIYTVVYRAQVRLTIKNPDGSVGATFEDGASGDSINQPGLGDAHDQAMKTALSQALKRVAVNLGDQFGLSLYNGGSRDATILRTAVGPVMEGGSDVVEQVTQSAPVYGEQETQAYRDDPGQQPGADTGTGLPSVFELRDEALDPNVSLERLGAINAMVGRTRGAHPHLGPTEVTNENGNAEALDALVYRKIKELKERRQ